MVPGSARAFLASSNFINRLRAAAFQSNHQRLLESVVQPVMTQSESQSSSSGSSIWLAVFGIVCIVLSSLMLNYEEHLVAQYLSGRQGNELWIEQFIWLCPVPVLILFRHVRYVTVPYAAIALAILIGRFAALGGEAFSYWASLLLQFILGGVSIAVLVIWIFMRMTFLLRSALKRRRA